ncbi:chemotaxis protein CheX [Neomoorella mulderi]|uniref:Chemotaxis phosphatase CheX-like domain-containing protein n=1 Tax=Moorella mulderi DSM 14980 TaxID=1122241 RepID=A0A151AT74_9FIRM|nr:chemotaxis protein CheX [Moorella mulderi]KYH30851.1 hypothetical protein MOMUL_28220 [Moorella mulderi DSM 14980]
MRAETVSPFIDEMVKVFQEELAITCQKKSVSLQNVPVTWHEVNVLIDIRGAAEAAVIYSMEEDTACALAGAFHKDKSFQGYCYEVEDSVKELFNIVSGQALKILENKGLACTLPGPPSVIMGRLHAVPVVSRPLLAVILDTTVGLVRVSVSMVDKAG